MKKLLLFLMLLFSVSAFSQNCQAYFTATQTVGTTNVQFQNLSFATGFMTSTWTIGTLPPVTTIGNVVYTFNFPTSGTYNVCLQINAVDSMTGSNCTSSFCDSIVVDTISTPCDAMFITAPDSASSNGFYFYNTSIASGWMTSVWDFGDGGTSTSTNTYHTYSANGWYYPCLTIAAYHPGDTTPYCTSTYCDTLIINSPPPCQASFITIQDSINGNLYYFFNTSTPQSTQSLPYYLWSFNGDTSSAQNPHFELTTLGYSSICLYISTPDGCTDYACDTLEYFFWGGIHELANDISIIYPNPANDILHIQMKTLDKYTINLYDMTGCLVQSTKVNTDLITMKLGWLSVGNYQLQIINQKGQVSSKKFSIIR